MRRTLRREVGDREDHNSSGARGAFAKSDAGLPGFEQQRRCDSEHRAESTRQMWGIRESGEVSGFSQVRSAHGRVRGCAEATPQNITSKGHAGGFAEAVLSIEAADF